MISLYGQPFLTKHGESDKNGHWFDVLRDLTPHALRGGLERLRTLKTGIKFSEFPPNAMQFRALCLAYYDEEIKLPSINKTMDEICEFVNTGSMHFSHPIIKYIASKLDDNFYIHARERRYYACREALQKVYEVACHVLRQGFELPEVILKSRAFKKTPPEVARNHLQHIRNLIGKSS